MDYGKLCGVLEMQFTSLLNMMLKKGHSPFDDNFWLIKFYYPNNVCIMDSVDILLKLKKIILTYLVLGYPWKNLHTCICYWKVILI